MDEIEETKNGKKIWIVEDDEGISEVTSLILQEKGYQASSIFSEEELFQMLEESEPDLILLDIFLYNANGADIAKKLKSNDETKNIPIVMMSADTQIVAKVQESGADDYIKKPFELSDLVRVIEKNIKDKNGNEINKPPSFERSVS